MRFPIFDENGNLINTDSLEKTEQDLADLFIKKNDIVLELGGRYGSVSCVINKKLANPTMHIVVEPDQRVWKALEINRNNNHCHFAIVKGFISRKKLSLTNLEVCHGGYGATSIEDENSNIVSFTLEQIMEWTKIQKITALVADCEGFLETFINENMYLLDTLRIIIFEADYKEKCNYDYLKNLFASNNFKEIIEGDQNVWMKF